MGRLPFRRHIEQILAGRCDSVHVAAPLLEPCQREHIAKAVRRGIRLNPFCDPRFLVVTSRGNVRALNAREFGGCRDDLASEGLVLYWPHIDPRYWGLRVYHGLAHIRLDRERVDYNETDAWLLTAELAYPRDLMRDCGPEVVEPAQQFAPRWFLDAWWMAAQPSGRNRGAVGWR